jgi:hypothetical protein
VSEERTVCAKLFIDTCRAKYWCSTEPSRIALPPSNERSSTVTRISRPRLKAIGPATGCRRTTGLTPIERTPSICRFSPTSAPIENTDRISRSAVAPLSGSLSRSEM